ncbi:MAG: 5-oxoprolinase subunit PxpB [Acidobacteriia bacterium]|nr:5-oxoprolinase subunit PxpB [Terriglobia bacterium]
MLPSVRLEIRPASDRSLLVSFGQEISIEAHREVLRMMRVMEKRPPGILNLHPAFTSVLVDLDPRRLTQEDVEVLIEERLARLEGLPPSEPRIIEIPVKYGGESGPDLIEVARITGLTPARVVERHAAAEYRVYFLGFSPGFPYLGGMPQELAVPRLATPRKRVPRGSVAIGGEQTGIYPLDSPGGWRIIGHTDLTLFDAAADPPALLRSGDSVRFVPQGEV